MDTCPRYGRLWKWCSLVASVAFLTSIRTSESEKCSSNNVDGDRFLMLVSTLDGRLTALDVGTGAEEWSISTGPNPLLSSSITNMELTRDGSSVRLIPSLDGGLYQYDGSGIEPVPLAADVLLSNSFRFSDDSTVVGGKQVENYGIDLGTGQLKYVCSSEGCENFTQNLDEDENASGDTLVITRHTKTIRAVELLTGYEKWNFSVGEHDVAYIKSEAKTTSSSGYRTGRDHRITREEIQHCSVDNEEEGFFDGFNFGWFSEEEAGTTYSADELQMKVIVPSGMVVAVLKNNPSRVVWQQQFGVAIANAWLLRGEELQEVNLFDTHNVPALSVQHTDTIPGHDGDEEEEDDTQAVLYVGVYKNQVYVQPSYSLQQEVHDATTRAVVTGDSSAIQMPRVHWKPYLATAFSRTPIMTQKSEKKRDGPVIDDSDRALVPQHIGYPFDEGGDEGVYLLQDYTPMPIGEDRQIEDRSVHMDMSQHHLSHLYNLWFGLFAISVLTVFVAIMVHLMFTPRDQQTDGKKSQDQHRTKRDSSSQSDASQTAEQEYTSRYYTDFEQIAVLGHGGFGVVFHSKNKLDDCYYAVKRIALNNSERAMEKVRREVKALATLDNAGIVRYHHSWFESPPAGWQEARDKVCIEMPSSSGYSGTEQSPLPSQISPFDENNPIRRLSQLYLSQVDVPYPRLDDINPLKPFSEERVVGERAGPEEGTIDDESWDVLEESVVADAEGRAGSSSGFTPRTMKFSVGDTESDEDTTEGDLGQSVDQSHCNIVSEDSFGISFRDDISSGVVGMSTSAPDLPFQAYDIDSSNTVSTDICTHSNSLDIVFSNSNCDNRSDDASTNCQNSPHSVITISKTNSQSKNRSKRQKSDVALSIQTGSTTSTHRRSASCDLASRATRPTDLPLRSQKCQTVAPPECKLYLYIQMQLCKRESLKDWLSSNKQARDRLLLLDIFHQIISAMDYVHDRGLMHRDLKPSNIFFSMDGIVKIGDFGLVTALEETVLTPYDGPAQPYNRHTGQVGTRLYMSPEQHAGKPYTQKIDIYALGLIFFELFYPFDTQMERIHTISDVKRLRFPQKFVQMLSANEVVFIKRMLSHDPEQRPSCKDILRQPMFASFEQVHQAYLHARARSSSRIRTYSTSSNSGSGSGSHSSPGADGLTTYPAV